MGQLAFFFNSSACTGCKTCQVACQDAHNLEPDVLLRKVHHYGGGTWVQEPNGIYAPSGIFRYYVSVSCNHCAKPACVEVCPTGAMTKDPETGIVSNSLADCIGCGSCAQACPYDAPRVDAAAEVTRKCDFCSDLLTAGEVPACVDACPQRALQFGEYDDLQSQFGDCTDSIEPLPQATTDPSLLIVTHQDAQMSGQGTGSVLDTPDES